MMSNIHGLSAEAFSAIAAFFSFFLSCYLVGYDIWKNKKKANTELYALTSALVGFIDFVQYTFFHNTTTLQDCSYIIEKVKILDKNILDSNRDYFLQ